MNAELQTGLYGKLPAYGDFIFRNLNSAFITPWDEWLQHFISASHEQIGEDWLNIYLTSPIWRFVLSPGVIDNNMWAGLMMPSVDRVGRYFPISIVKPFSSNISPVNFILQQHDWFNVMETHCLTALNGNIDVDELISIVTEVEVLAQQHYQATYNLGEIGPMLFGLAADDEEPLNNVMPYMLSAALATGLNSFSLWQTAGSELVSPVMFSCQGLPPIGGIASMLDGQWQQRNWKIPYAEQRLG